MEGITEGDGGGGGGGSAQRKGGREGRRKVRGNLKGSSGFLLSPAGLEGLRSTMSSMSCRGN